MVRFNKTENASSILRTVVREAKNSHVNSIVSTSHISKKDLWMSFLQTFMSLTGKQLILDDQTINNLKVLFNYFLRDNDFFCCPNLRGDISKPSFDKGLLIIGTPGVGKTIYLNVFEKIFMGLPPLRFRGESSKNLVRQYEVCSTPSDKEVFFGKHQRKRLFIDDLNSEPIASNYGKYDVVGSILTSRHEKGLTTYATTNYITLDKSAEHTLETLGERYGFRLYDRLFEMFNVIEFHGSSYRR